ncbi:MAG: hypothetical protein HC779_05420, partial [Phyllobacteriaceae bacterium]|nr:hypothetical protein [Phyllobacteriaceae bacterium]
ATWLVLQVWAVLLVLPVCLANRLRWAGGFDNGERASNAGSSPDGADSQDSTVPLYGPDGHVRKLEDIESDMIRLAITRYDGQLSEVARRLGIGRSTLYRKLGELGISTAQTVPMGAGKDC